MRRRELAGRPGAVRRQAGEDGRPRRRRTGAGDQRRPAAAVRILTGNEKEEAGGAIIVLLPLEKFQAFVANFSSRQLGASRSGFGALSKAKVVAGTYGTVKGEGVLLYELDPRRRRNSVSRPKSWPPNSKRSTRRPSRRAPAGPARNSTSPSSAPSGRPRRRASGNACRRCCSRKPARISPSGAKRRSSSPGRRPAKALRSRTRPQRSNGRWSGAKPTHFAAGAGAGFATTGMCTSECLKIPGTKGLFQ
ncbi:hypothetical protein EMGBD4_16170 [Verrucomicrobiota bacterium]|nr:hypothetical protein EMGBD4_16170 [Verrucomicrobiota bacterium]